MQITVQDMKSTGIHSEGGRYYMYFFSNTYRQCHPFTCSVGYTALSGKNLNGMGRRVRLKMSGQTMAKLRLAENADII